VDELASWLTSNVWTDVPVVERYAWDDAPLAAWVSQVPFDGYYVKSYDEALTDGSPAARLVLYDGDRFAEEEEVVVGHQDIDLFTGAEVERDALREDPDADEWGLPDLSLLPDMEGWPIGLEGGPAAVLGAIELDYLGRGATRSFVWQGADHGWQGTSPLCRERASSEDLFIAGDRIWITSRQGPVISWTPILAARR
jgi:hypothetical protein